MIRSIEKSIARSVSDRLNASIVTERERWVPMAFDPQDYHREWPEIRRQILEQANHKCEFCGVRNHAKGARDRWGKWHDEKDLGPLMIADDWQPELVDQIYTEKAIDFITRHVEGNNGQPFYLHLTPEAPHRPNIVPDFMKGTSDTGIRGDHVQMFDWMVGEIMNTLKSLKLDQNTLVIVTSDNGPTGGLDGSFNHKAAGELRGYKGGLYEGGHRVPFIAHWPGKIEPESESDILICLTDMMASFAAILDYQLKEEMGEDSFNILPAFFGEQNEIRETMINRHYNGDLSIRKGPWKLLGEELYNLETDCKESQDMAQDHPEIVESLKDLLQKQIAAGRITNTQ